MYEKQFQFESRPFCFIPSAEYYFPASSIDSALETIRLCVDRASGPSLIFGQSGWGKSQLLAVLHREFKQRFRVALINACTRMSRRHDLLQNILFELGQPYRDLSEGELRLALIDYLKPNAQCPNGVLLLIDDGQTLPIRLLDELRMVTNFVREGQPRVRLVIAGTPALEERLTHPQLDSLNQRVAARCYLQSLRSDEVEAYVKFQIARAGCTRQDLFSDSAISAIAQLCEGNPRMINQVSDHALILAASCGQNSVDGEMIAEALSDLQHFRVNHRPTYPSAGQSPNDKAVDGGNVVEFGTIDEPVATAAPKQPNATTQANTTEPSHFIDASIGEFSKMVDSLSQLYAISLDDEGGDSSDLPDSRSSPKLDEKRSENPFAESFAEECGVADNYVEMAARQNHKAIQISEEDATHLEQQLMRLPIVEHPSYQRDERNGDAPAAPSRAATVDDRDMLLISPDRPLEYAAQPTYTTDFCGVSVSRGQAVRVEYGKLFQQLRGGASTQISH